MSETFNFHDFGHGVTARVMVAADIAWFARDVCAEDAAELAAYWGEDVEREVREAFDASRAAWLVCCHGECVAAAGFCHIDEGEAVWMLTTTALARHKRLFARHYRAVYEGLLGLTGEPRRPLLAHVLKDYERCLAPLWKFLRVTPLRDAGAARILRLEVP